MPDSALKEIKKTLDGLRLPGQDKTSKAEIGNGLVSRRFRVFDYPEFFSRQSAMNILERHFSGRKVRIREEGEAWLAIEVAEAAAGVPTIPASHPVPAPSMLNPIYDMARRYNVSPSIGRTAAEITDIDEILEIAAAYVPGVCGFKQVERRFGLREANGMTAYRIVQKAKAILEHQRRRTAHGLAALGVA